MSTYITIGKESYAVGVFDALLPPLTPAELAALREDIKVRGVLVPVVTDEENVVIDGAHRLRIAAELGLSCVPVEVVRGLSDEEKRSRAVALNVHRRHLSPEARAEVVARLRAEGKSASVIAEIVGVSPSTVRSDLECSGSQNRHPEHPAAVQGADGKHYPAAKPTPEAAEARQAEVERLHDEGTSVRDIAAKVGASTGTVQGDLKKGRARRGRRPKPPPHPRKKPRPTLGQPSPTVILFDEDHAGDLRFSGPDRVCTQEERSAALYLVRASGSIFPASPTFVIADVMQTYPSGRLTFVRVSGLNAGASEGHPFDGVPLVFPSFAAFIEMVKAKVPGRKVGLFLREPIEGFEEVQP